MTALIAIIGVGQPDRGDDAVGLTVADRVAARAPVGVDVGAVMSPVELVDAWSDYDTVVVVDGVHTGSPVGSLSFSRIDEGGPVFGRDVRLGHHPFGVGEAIELARILNRLPRRLILVGIEVGCIELGAGLSNAVAAAVDDAVEMAMTAAARDNGNQA